MKIGYFMNSYPMTSTTFIRDEIQALEAQGVEIERYAIRQWHQPLVDENDKSEQRRTRYILTGRTSALIFDFIAEAISNPAGLLRALGTWQRLVRNAGGGFVRHCAYLLEAASLKRRTKQDNIQHLHTHFAANSAAVALLSERFGGPSFSFTVHGPDDFENTVSLSLREKIVRARFVAAISNYCRAQLASAAGIDVWSKLKIVRCGVDADTFTPSATPFDDNSTFVCVGRFSRHKAQVLIVEATSRVAHRYPQVRVLLIGDGENRDAIEEAIHRLGMSDHVILMGWKSNVEVRQTLGQARAFLLPSFAEGLPVAIMEAFAMGRPVISTYIAGIPELVDDSCGWLVPAGSIEEIERAMIAALETPSSKLMEMGQEGRRRVLQTHDVNRNAAGLRKLFSGVVDA